MSSLRISHPNRGIGALGAGGDTGRSEHADEGASFAVALGAAAGVAPKDAVALLGGKPGDGEDFSSASRKRTETPAKPGDPASIAADATGAVVVGAAVTPPTTVQPAAGGHSSEATAISGSHVAAAGAGSHGPAVAARSPTIAAASAAPRSAPVAQTGVIQNSADDASTAPRSALGAQTKAILASKTTVASSEDALLSAPTPTLTVAPLATTPVPTSSDAIMNGTAPTDGTSSALALSSAATSVPQTLAGQSSAPPIGIGVDTSSPSIGPDTSPAGIGIDASLIGAGAVVTPGVLASPIAAPVQLPPAPALSVRAATTGTASIAPGGTPSAVTVGTAVDATGLGAPPAFALPTEAAPGGGGATGTPDLANVVTPSQTLPTLTVGQPATAYGPGGFGFAAHDRFVPIASASDTSSVVASSANAATGDASVPAASSTAVASGATPDPSSANTIADQVSGQLARMVSNGSREMVMRLHPPELGDLTVRVAVSGRDVAAWFTSPQPQVQSAISAAIGQLQTDLGNAGYNLSGAWVGADASSARQQESSSAPPSPAPRAPFAAVNALPGTTVPIRSPSPGLNIYV